MRLRETPETDAAIIDELDVELVATGSGRWKGDTKMQLVPADFARKLERKRDEARAALALVSGDCLAWLNSESDEPSVEFIKAVQKFAHKESNALLQEAAK